MLYLSWREVTKNSSNMGSCSFRFFCIKPWSYYTPFNKCSSKENLYWSLVSIIHNNPTWWNTTALMKTVKISIIAVSEHLQVTVLLQRFHWIKMSVTSSLSNWNQTLNKENTLSIDSNNGKSHFLGIFLAVKLKTLWGSTPNTQQPTLLGLSP